jgi:hypothetical protein
MELGVVLIRNSLTVATPARGAWTPSAVRKMRQIQPLRQQGKPGVQRLESIENSPGAQVLIHKAGLQTVRFNSRLAIQNLGPDALRLFEDILPDLHFQTHAPENRNLTAVEYHPGLIIPHHESDRLKDGPRRSSSRDLQGSAGPQRLHN